MMIRKATMADLPGMIKLYDDVCDDLAAHTNYPGWSKGDYPTERDAKLGIEDDSLYVALENEEIVGSIIMRHTPEKGYEQVKWLTEDDYERIMVLYTLAVHPLHTKKGIAKALMDFAEEEAKRQHCISLRLDMTKGNLPAEHLYRKCGYRYIDTVSLGYEDCGLPWFDLYEKPLNGDVDVIQARLFALQDQKYALFQSKLTPGIDPSLFIGVRVPEVRKLAKELYKKEEYHAFLHALPHKYYDENMLHGLILSEYKDYDSCIEGVDAFLPYVDNWAVCDIMSPKCFKKNKDRLLADIRRWTASDHTYTCRFGMEMLMTHFLDEAFRPEYLEIPAAVKLDDYYAKMMVAWFFATALTKQWDASLPYITENRLELWIHNKTIQKARESYRITPEQKELLKSLKR